MASRTRSMLYVALVVLGTAVCASADLTSDNPAAPQQIHIAFRGQVCGARAALHLVRGLANTVCWGPHCVVWFTHPSMVECRTTTWLCRG